MSKPTDDIEFATDVGALVTDPGPSKKKAGFDVDEAPPAHWFDWLFRAYWRWIAWFDLVLGTDTNQTILVAGQSGATRETITATAAATNKGAIKGTGKGSGTGVAGYGDTTGAGVVGIGGASGGGNATGVIGAGGGGNAVGVDGQGSGTGEGVTGEGGSNNADGVSGMGGGSTGRGVRGFGATSGVGVRGDGGSTAGEGGYFTRGDSSTGTGSSDDAVTSIQNVKFGGSNPAKTTGFSNRQTPLNLPKAWVRAKGQGGSAPTFTDGFNVASVTRISNSTIRVTFATAMADANYIVAGMAGEGGFQPIAITNRGTSSFDVSWYVAGGSAQSDSTNNTIEAVIFGRQ